MSFAILLRVVDSDTKHQGNVRKAVVLFFGYLLKETRAEPLKLPTTRQLGNRKPGTAIPSPYT